MGRNLLLGFKILWQKGRRTTGRNMAKMGRIHSHFSDKFPHVILKGLTVNAPISQFIHETFKEKKQGYDDEIERLEQKVSDARMAQRLVTDADDEAKEKIETAKTFLDLKEMNEDAWETFVDEVLVYPDYRMEIHWSFEDQ